MVRMVVQAGLAMCLGAGSVTAAQDPKPRERESGKTSRPAAEAKWERGQKKDHFNATAAKESQVKPDSKTPPTRERDKEATGGRAADVKADKWRKNQNRDKFNEHANPRPPDRDNSGGGNSGGGGGGKNGGGSPPSTPSGPKPKSPSGPRP